VFGSGVYATIRHYRRGDAAFPTYTDWSPGISAGIGVSGSTRLTPVLEARWHRYLTPFLPDGTQSEYTDVAMISAGLRFQ
jgi:hypothetical protein